MKAPRAIERAVLAGATSVVGVNLPQPADMGEREFQSRLVALARDHGWLHYHTHDSRRSDPGFPDLVLVRAGVLIVAELKVKRNRPTAAQREWLDAFGAVPGVGVHHWRPEHWPDIVRILSTEGTA